MGCNNSVQLQTELAALRKEVESLKKEIVDADAQKVDMQLEVKKAKDAVLSLSEENEKLMYQQHSRRNEEGPVETRVFESCKEEFSKVKEWSEHEIAIGNSILSTLLSNSELTPKDPAYKEISDVMANVKESIFDPDSLLQHCRKRAKFIEDLLNSCIEFKKEAALLIKVLESTFTGALKVVRDIESEKFAKELTEAKALEKLRVMRNIIRRFGFNGSYASVVDEDRERELEIKVQTLTTELKSYEAKVKTLEETVEELEAAQEDDMDSPMESKLETPAPEEPKQLQRRMSRRPTFMDGGSFQTQPELTRANERLKIYDEHMHDVQIAAKAAREKGSKEATLRLMICIETMVAAVKERDANTYGGAPSYD